MSFKTIIITGGTSGIGLAGARLLARRGHRLILLGRKTDQGLAALESLAPISAGEHRFIAADLSLMEEVRKVGAQLMTSEASIDVLVNNVGTWFKNRQLTAEGIERTVATNHLSYVGMSLALKPLLMAASAPRVVNTGSFVYRQARFDPINLQAERSFGTNKTYAASKLYNVMWTRALADLWSEDGITVSCFSPGFVATEFGKGEGGFFEPYYRFIRKFGKTPEDAAGMLVRLADDPLPAGANGAYFENGAIRDTRKVATDKECKALMSWSVDVTGILGDRLPQSE